VRHSVINSHYTGPVGMAGTVPQLICIVLARLNLSSNCVTNVCQFLSLFGICKKNYRVCKLKSKAQALLSPRYSEQPYTSYNVCADYSSEPTAEVAILQVQCELCNDKKLAAKRVSELSSELFFSVFVRVRWRHSVVVSTSASINVVNQHWTRLVLG